MKCMWVHLISGLEYGLERWSGLWTGMWTDIPLCLESIWRRDLKQWSPHRQLSSQYCNTHVPGMQKPQGASLIVLLEGWGSLATYHKCCGAVTLVIIGEVWSGIAILPQMLLCLYTVCSVCCANTLEGDTTLYVVQKQSTDCNSTSTSLFSPHLYYAVLPDEYPSGLSHRKNKEVELQFTGCYQTTCGIVSLYQTCTILRWDYRNPGSLRWPNSTSTYHRCSCIATAKLMLLCK